MHICANRGTNRHADRFTKRLGREGAKDRRSRTDSWTELELTTTEDDLTCSLKQLLLGIADSSDKYSTYSTESIYNDFGLNQYGIL